MNKYITYSEEVKNVIAHNVKEADKLEIIGTPTIIVGMKKLLGVGSYQQLREDVKSQGGKLKPEYE